MKTVFRRVMVSWMAAVFFEYVLLSAELRSLTDIEGTSQMSLLRVSVLTAAGVFLLYAVSHFRNTDRAERWVAVIVFSALALVSLYSSYTLPYLTVCVLIIAGLTFYNVNGTLEFSEIFQNKQSKIFLWITVGLSVCFFAFVSMWTVCRIYSFSTPGFDLGIFSQMFYHLKESGIPLTTIERGGLMSHFYVHVSPIWYLLLPFYALIPIPATLQVLQAAIITSSLIPLWKICKNRGMSGVLRMLFCVLLMLYPAFSGGTSYDIHENCFLTPLILWIFYGIEKKNTAIIAVSALLTLTVKEDAAVYVAVIAVWMIVKGLLNYKQEGKRSFVIGLVIFGVSLSYFFLVTSFLSKSGDGVMTYRYNNFFYGDSSSLFTIVRAVMTNPMKVVYECVDLEKLQFILLTLLPICGLPFITRKYERYILLIPYVLINLMPDYTYQHDIFFQYTFGSTAFLIYLSVVNVSEFKTDRKKLAVLISAVVVSAVCFITVIVPKAVRYPNKCIQNSELYQSMSETLDKIPEDASVTATTFYTVYLSQRDVLYELRYSSLSNILDTEYIVLDVSAESNYSKYADKGKKNGFENFVRIIQNSGYELYADLDGVMVIYRDTKISG